MQNMYLAGAGGSPSPYALPPSQQKTNSLYQMPGGAAPGSNGSGFNPGMFAPAGVTSGTSYPGLGGVNSGVSSPYGQPYGQPGMGMYPSGGAQGQIGGGSTPPLGQIGGGSGMGTGGSGAGPMGSAYGALGSTLGGMFGGSSQSGSQQPSASGSGYQTTQGTPPSSPTGMPPAPGSGGSTGGASSQQPGWMTAMGADGWPAYVGDMGGIPAPGSTSNAGGMSASSGAASPSNWDSYANSAAAQPSPYLQNQLKGMLASVNQNITQNILPSIQSNAAAVGGIGGARQGIAQGTAIGNAMTGYQNAASQAIEQANEAAQNRALQAYQGDQSTGLGYFGANNNFQLGLGQNQNTANQIGANYNAALGQLGLGYAGLQNQNQNNLMNFYTQQRGQDLTQAQLGGSLYGGGMQGPWQALLNEGNLYSPFTGFGNTNTQNSQGGGGLGALGGALSGSALWNWLAGQGAGTGG